MKTEVINELKTAVETKRDYARHKREDYVRRSGGFTPPQSAHAFGGDYVLRIMREAVSGKI